MKEEGIKEKKKGKWPERKDETKQESRVGYGTLAFQIATHHQREIENDRRPYPYVRQRKPARMGGKEI
jgi:hypothetical protein